MTIGLKHYLESLEARMRTLERENELLKENSKFMVMLLHDILQAHNGSTKHRIQDIVRRIGDFLTLQSRKKEATQSVDLISDIIRGRK
jgi:CRP-like cAMP-binding protein